MANHQVGDSKQNKIVSQDKTHKTPKLIAILRIIGSSCGQRSGGFQSIEEAQKGESKDRSASKRKTKSRKIKKIALLDCKV